MQYNWTVATAGSTLSSGSATNSIRPKGWRLPINGEYGELQIVLGRGNSGDNVINSPWRGLYAGSNGTTDQGNRGRYWSATACSGSNAYYLTYNSSEVLPGHNDAKTPAHTVRCVLR